jgi:hypothetical protein
VLSRPRRRGVAPEGERHNPSCVGIALIYACQVVSCVQSAPMPPKTVDMRTRTAHHEAGHAVLSAAINDRPARVSIRGQDGTLGRSTQRMFVRPTSLAQVYLAGFAAEHLLTCRRPRGFDIEVGLGVIAHLDRRLVEKIEGVDATDGYGAVHQVLRSGVREVEDEIRAEVERLYDVVRESLRAVWRSVKTIAEALLDHEELDQDALEQAFGDADVYAPVFAVQHTYGMLPDLPVLAVVEGPLVEAAATMPPASAPKRARRPTKGKPGALGAPDPRVTALLRALERDPKLASVVDAYEKEGTTPGRKFGKNALKTRNGKLFALFTQATLVLKLPNERVAALVAQGVGKPFDPGHGRLMKGWLSVTSAKASWIELTREAFVFAGANS